MDALRKAFARHLCAMNIKLNEDERQFEVHRVAAFLFWRDNSQVVTPVWDGKLGTWTLPRPVMQVENVLPGVAKVFKCEGA